MQTARLYKVLKIFLWSTKFQKLGGILFNPTDAKKITYKKGKTMSTWSNTMVIQQITTTTFVTYSIVTTVVF